MSEREDEADHDDVQSRKTAAYSTPHPSDKWISHDAILNSDYLASGLSSTAWTVCHRGRTLNFPELH